jgi:hypothetical protein
MSYTFNTTNPTYKKTVWFKVVKAVASSKAGLTKTQILNKVGITPPTGAASGYRNSLFHSLRDRNLIRYDRKAGKYVAGRSAAKVVSR